MIDYRVILLTPEPDADFSSVYSDPRLKYTYKVDLSSTYNPMAVSGIEKLKQRIITVMLGSPGTDIWDNKKGAGLLALFGKSLAFHSDALKTEVALIVMNTQSQIVKEQTGRTFLDPTEKLSQLRLSRLVLGSHILEPIEIIPEETMIKVRPYVITAAGETSFFSVAVTTNT